MNRNQKKRRIMISSLVFLFFLLFFGISYALWKISLIQEEKNHVSSSCFKITLEEANEINLNNAYPITDEDGMKSKPYVFKIQNVCETTAFYQVNLEELETVKPIYQNIIESIKRETIK